MKYFGTDGFRGTFTKEITTDICLRIGRAVGAIAFNNSKNKNPFIVLGKDPRISSYIISNILSAGICEMGVDVLYLTVVPTPAVAYITRNLKAYMGVMVTASHNLYQDNGIKLFSNEGFKLEDAVIKEIEDLIDEPEKLEKYKKPKKFEFGHEIFNNQAKQKYFKYLVDEGIDLKGMHIAIDSANGATSEFASKLFSELNAKVSVIGNDPNGININENVGSTSPQTLVNFVKEVNADIGFAFDGDGDRLICVDENGIVRDGDYILFLCAKYLKEKNMLNKNTVVCTIMSNMGLHNALNDLDINVIKTDVGDKYVSQAMLQGAYLLGGETSGHVLFLQNNTTGDGMLTALKLLTALKYFNLTLGEASQMLKKFPNILVNIKVKDKEYIINNKELMLNIKKINNNEKNTRVILRASGTENVIRLLVESEDQNTCYELSRKIVYYIKEITNNNFLTSNSNFLAE